MRSATQPVRDGRGARTRPSTATTLALGFTLAGCLAEVGTGVTPGDDELAVSQQGLTGLGETFWIPPRNELLTTIPYCFEDLNAMSARRGQFRTALAATWERHANLWFADQGSCSSAPDAARAIHVNGWDRTAGQVGPTGDNPLFGTQLAGRSDGMWMPRDSVTISDNDFQVMVAHEFGHALGFWHEHTRDDWEPNATNCPNLFVLWGLPTEQTPNTPVTALDLTSIMERGYCAGVGTPTLSTSDIAGVASIYGASCRTQGCAYVRFGDQFEMNAIRFQLNRRWLQPTDGGAANTQYFVGDWERVTIFREGGSPADGVLRYGDVVGIKDRFGRWLSGRDAPTNEVNMQPHFASWERWRVETIDNNRYPTGSRVYVNAPMRLRNVRWDRWLGSSSSGRDVFMTTATQASELRIQGPMVPLHWPP